MAYLFLRIRVTNIMKKFLYLLIICILLSGCSNENVNADTDVLTNDSGEVNKTSETEEIAETNNEDSEEVGEVLEENFSFAEFKNINFTFLSGAGGWSTELTVAEDGMFSGTYHDSEMGSYTEDYPNGTYYYCSFHGKFTEPVQQSEYIYSTTIESISYDNPVGTEEIKDGIRYIYSDAYGLDNPKEILIYLPGIPIEELPEGYLSWVASNWRMDYEFTLNNTTLPFYGLYNVIEEQGFSSYDIVEDLKQSLVYREKEAVELEEALMNDPNLTQADLNEKSHLMYQIWDTTLNEIWRILKRNLNEDEMSVLTKEQLDWITMKETSMKEAGAEFEGGSMYGMVVNQVGAELTKERVYELLKVVDEVRK